MSSENGNLHCKNVAYFVACNLIGRQLLKCTEGEILLVISSTAMEDSVHIYHMNVADTGRNSECLGVIQQRSFAKLIVYFNKLFVLKPNTKSLNMLTKLRRITISVISISTRSLLRY
jgi:hypothetical protein